MKALASLLLSSITASLPALAVSASAAPMLYTSSFKHEGKYLVCASQAKQAMTKIGLTNFEEAEISSNFKYAAVMGYNKKGTIAVEILCDEKLGITTFAVAGDDPDETYDFYEKFYDAEW